MVGNRGKILIFIDWFIPAYKAGGPIVAARNFAVQMQEYFEIFIITSDRDLGEDSCLAGIQKDCWVAIDRNVKVWYTSQGGCTLSFVKDSIQKLSPDFVYLHSMFSLRYTIFPIIGTRPILDSAKVILAPRGMLRSSALKIKPIKKKIFLLLFKFMGLGRNLTFHATDLVEYEDILKWFGRKAKVVELPDFGVSQTPYSKVSNKKPGHVKLLFVGRIHPIKNLDFLLRALLHVKGNVELYVLGNIEQMSYWRSCEELIGTYPKSISVKILDAVPHEQTDRLIRDADFVVLPTLGENFGHAIYEAMAKGTPVLISDQTKWKDLEKYRAGWDLPLKERLFVDKIQQIIDMDTVEYISWSQGAWNYCNQYNLRNNLTENYKELLFDK